MAVSGVQRFLPLLPNHSSIQHTFCNVFSTMRRRASSTMKKDQLDTRPHPFHLPPILDIPPTPNPTSLTGSPWTTYSALSRSEDRLASSPYHNNSMRSRSGSESVTRASSSAHHLPPPPALPVERPPSYEASNLYISDIRYLSLSCQIYYHTDS